MDDREIISDLVVTATSIATFVIDLVIGSLVLWKQYQNSDFIVLFFVAFIILTPGFITSVLSIIRMCREPSALPRLPPFFRFLRYFCILCHISPISGYAESLYFLLKRYEALVRGELVALQRAYDAMKIVAADVSRLRLFHAVFTAAPQLALQLYLLINCRAPGNLCNDDTLEMVAILASLLSLAVAMTSYNRSTRYILLGNEESFLSTIVLFMHHGCAISARIMAFSMLACISVEYVFVICAIHWIVMFMWLVLAISRTGVFRCEKFVNCFALATAYSCVFINHDTGRTRYKYLFYYSICFVENTAMMIMWILYSNPAWWCYYLGFIGHYVFFVSGIILLIAYHLKFHPKGWREPDGDGPDDRSLETE